MKIKFLIIAVLSVQCYISIAQTKSTAPKKNNVVKQSEIDRLYDKYKNSGEIKLFTPYGELDGSVYINFNDDNKPESVLSVLIRSIRVSINPDDF